MSLRVRTLTKPSRRRLGPASCWPTWVALGILGSSMAAVAADISLVPQLGHGDSVTSLAFSPDGRVLLTGGSDGSVALWDVETAAEIRSFSVHSDGVFSVAFSPDGTFVLIGGGSSGQLFDSHTGAEIRSFRGGSGSVFAVAFSLAGDLVAIGSGDGTIKISDTLTGAEIRSFSSQSFSDIVFSLEFSPDANFLLAGSEKGARLWDARTGLAIHSFSSHSDSVGFSPDGQIIITGGPREPAKLWDARSGAEIRTLSVDQIGVAASWSPELRATFTAGGKVAFSPDGCFVLTGGGGTAKLWDARTGTEIGPLHGSGDVSSLAFSPDGRFLATGGDGTIKLWDAASRVEIRSFSRHATLLTSFAISPDGHYLLTGSKERIATLWDLEGGAELRTFPSHDWVRSVAISRDGQAVLVGGLFTARLWNAQSGVATKTFSSPYSIALNSVALSPDGRFVLIAGLGMDNPARVLDKKAREKLRGFGYAELWDARTGARIRPYRGHSDQVDSVAFSADGRLVLTGGENARLWATQSGRNVHSFTPRSASGDPPSVSAVAFSSDGRLVLTANWDVAKLWNAQTGAEIRSFVGHSDRLTSVAFSPDARFVLTGSTDTTARLWDAENGAEIRTFSSPDPVIAVAFYRDGRIAAILTASGVKLWDTRTGAQLCSLISSSDRTWAVVAPDGRFDTNSLDDSSLLHWVASDDPMRALPFEIFMRDYYEPGLLRRILAGEKFPPIASPVDLNRVQPEVKIAAIEREPEDGDLLNVSVEVSRAEREFERATGVYDLRLFRDGQIVGEWPPPRVGSEVTGSRAGLEALRAWREASTVAVDAMSGRKIVTFKRIKLPRRMGVKNVEFSAYAFNEDRVKSKTARSKYQIPEELRAVRGRAYVIAVGVNASEDPAFGLRFAANDARTVGAVLSEKLSKLAEYEDVVRISLISDYEVSGESAGPTETAATKASVKAVLDLLAGREIGTATKIPNAARIKTARPEDLVLISFSGHGVDRNGVFYFLPYDIGKGPRQGMPSELLEHAISSEELTDWLRDVDAGQMALIVDACHSAAVQGEGFKPGPMGSRGLGQLAYDKKMRILAASQTAQVAKEYVRLEHGLLTYVLVHDGLETGLADYKPKDGKVTLAEWLAYGVERVPILDEQIKESLDLLPTPQAFQQPVLFDFASALGDVTIAK